MFKNWRLKKVYGVKYFYTDPDNRYHYYYRKNWLDQFDIMVYDIKANSNRWFMVTSSVFFSFVGLIEYDTLMTHKRNISTGELPNLTNSFIDDFGYSLLAYTKSYISSSSVVGNLSEYGSEENRKKVLLLKRIATAPTDDKDFVLGIDTLEIPYDGVVKFVKDVKKRHFKGVEIVIEPEEE